MDSHYRVDWSKTLRERFLELARKASEQGVRKQFLEASNVIFHQLQTDPLAFGDLRFRLGKMEVRARMIGVLFVEYGVNNKEKVVWVKDIVLMVE